MKIFKVKVWVDDGWERFSTKHIVLAHSEDQAKKLVSDFWMEKDDTNIILREEIEEITNGGIIL